jgi:hypothetical protein
VRPFRRGTLRDPTARALAVWLGFFGVAAALNFLVPTWAGIDLEAWTYSALKRALIFTLVYGLWFTAVPLLDEKGWAGLRRRDLLGLGAVAVLGSALAAAQPWFAAATVGTLALLHVRGDLSGLGVRSRGALGDALAVALLVAASALDLLGRGPDLRLDWRAGLAAALARLFANPASSVENLFYFGYLTERLARRIRGWAAPVVAGLYTLHEMSNPEYWLEGMSFGFTFLAVLVTAAVFLWRRSVIVIWLASGLARGLGSAWAE